jgi:phage terminase Nu1 subunit (DNA packaging protein)
MRQKELAAALGVSQQMVSKAAQQGMPCDSVEAAREWRRVNLDPTKTKTRKRTADGERLIRERARLVSARADKVAMENAVRRGELAPRALLEQALMSVVSQIVAILESIPAQVKRSSSAITGRELTIIKREIDKARTAMSEAKL